MMRWIGIALAAVVLSACTAAEPIPEGYTGPTAHIRDSSTERGSTSVDLFFLSKIDGGEVFDSLSATANANYGRGFMLEPAVIGRDVPARAAVFTIEGRTHYAAPILELFNTVYEVSGESRFTPAPNRTYVVKGELRDGYTTVWLEDSETGEMVGQRIEQRE